MSGGTSAAPTNEMVGESSSQIVNVRGVMSEAVEDFVQPLKLEKTVRETVLHKDTRNIRTAVDLDMVQRESPTQNSPHFQQPF